MFAVLRRFSEADVSMLVDPALIDKEVLMDLHNSCKNKQAEKISRQTHKGYDYLVLRLLNPLKGG